MTGRVGLRTLWQLARPGGMLLVLALPAVGIGYGHWEWALTPRGLWAGARVVAAWWFLSAGTLWLNAALDQDVGEVLMGRTVAVPPGLQPWAHGALLVAVALGGSAGWLPALCVVICAALAVAYSHPATAWKGHAVGGPLVNVVGYGALSPIAGWATVGHPPTPRAALALVLVMTWVAATYFGAQAFQADEDARRGYRTFVVTHGEAACVGLARALYAFTFWAFLLAAVAGLFPLAVWFAAPAWWWLDRHLAAWRQRPGAGAGAGRVMLRRATLVSVVVMLTILMAHGVLLAQGGPPAGLGTSWQPGT